jgi:hypothetical protein
MDCLAPPQGEKNPRTDLIKNEYGDLLPDSYILNKCKNYFSQLLNVHRGSDVRQIEIHTAEPLVPDPSPFEVEIAIANSRNYKLSGNNQILAGLIEVGGNITG